jgi:peptide/nickel transport system ATP-binding protein
MMVMYAGRCVESGITSEILDRPMHPYTAGLLESHPSRGLKPIPFGDRDILPGECAFANRCRLSCPDCTNELFVYGNREVRCHRVGDD